MNKLAQVWRIASHPRELRLALSGLGARIAGDDAMGGLSADETARWDALLALRSDVLKALELARADKTVGKPLDAKITLPLGDKAQAAWELVKDADLAQLFIVSEVETACEPAGFPGEALPGVTVAVSASELPKCPRCWTHSAGIGSDADHPELCPRCAAAIK